MNPNELAASLHPLERKVLPIIENTKDFKEIVQKTKLQDVEVMRALQWLQNKKIIRVNQTLKELVQLDENGLKYREKGLPEKSFLLATGKDTSLSEIKKKANLGDQEMNIGLGLLQRKGAITTKKEKELLVSITEQGNSLLKNGFPEELFLKKTFPITTADLSKEEKDVLEGFKKRKSIVKVSITKDISAEITEIGSKVLKAGISEENIIDRITPTILSEGSWKNKTLRRYDVSINVPSIHGGKFHFVDQSMDYIKRIWLDLGFKEMHGSLVQTSFWDLDALFVPQDHPARDMQDTFYLKDPKDGKIEPSILKKVKATHENGWTTKSKGWRYQWSEEKAKENLLRTHTTVLSAKTIHSLKKDDLPAKYFSVGKVFRNETLSWKHLFEFVQIEGIVVDPNANFKHLKGYLHDFFSKMGFTKIRIRPGHFPYTEPSAEVDVWHPTKNQWVELGGSGLFRPEVVKPLLGEAVPVLAWGLGLERSIMEYYALKDVRDIYKNDIKQLREMKLWMK